MGVRGIRSQILSYVPRWLSNRPTLNVGFKFLWTTALMLDIAIEAMIEGVRARYPGHGTAPTGWQFVDPDSALPYIARSRGLIQGETESTSVFAARARAWLQSWQNAGSSEVLAEMIQAYVGNTPTVRVIERSGFWTSIDPAGNVTYATAAWDWDSKSAPERSLYWSDLWIVVTPCEWPITGTSLSSLVGVWGKQGAPGVGHTVSPKAVQDILTLVATFKGAHTWVGAIIFAYDATLFDPATPGASGNPDGTWAYWGKLVAGALVPARTGASDGRVRYWTPYDKNYPGNAGSFPASAFVVANTDPPCASNMVVAMQGLADRTAYLEARFPHVEMNWRPEFQPAALGSGIEYFGAACWDPWLSRWIMGTYSLATGHLDAFASYGQDDGAQWTPVGTGDVYSGSYTAWAGISTDPTVAGTYWALILAGTGPTTFTQMVLQTSSPLFPAWTTNRTWNASGLYTGGAVIAFGKYVVAAIGSAHTGNAMLSSTLDDGVTWSDFLPYVTPATPVPVRSWKLASSGTLLIAVPVGLAVYFTSPDGVTWTQRSASTLLPNNLCVLRNVAWDAARNVWVAAVQTNVEGAGPEGTTFYTSPDGIAWTFVRQAGPTGLDVSDFALVGNGYACALTEAAPLGPGTAIVSTDGAVSWRRSPATLKDNIATTVAYYQRPQFARGSAMGLLFFNSNWARFSDLAALPPHL